jgi:hypothetical protein
MTEYVWMPVAYRLTTVSLDLLIQFFDRIIN